MNFLNGTLGSLRKNSSRVPEQSKVVSVMSYIPQSGSESQRCLSLIRIVRNQDIPAGCLLYTSDAADEDSSV